MAKSESAGVPPPSWWVRNVSVLKSSFRIVFGLVWLVDGALKFTSGFVNSFSQAVNTAAGNSPGFLNGWYSFWQSQATTQPYLIVYTVGVLELVLGIALILGLLRKVSYLGGAVLSLLIWAVPEGFGGPYQGGAGGTDVGAGIVYALVFLGLILINAMSGTSRFSLDFYIERRLPSWRSVAEFGPSEGRKLGTDRIASSSPDPSTARPRARKSWLGLESRGSVSAELDAQDANP